ncbi:MAG: hypothetical protein GEU97_06495 [Actinophytocola sp.]|nr:hypothetical protein [Actinophytocola sp.]
MSTRQIGPVGTTLRVIGAVGLLVIAVIDFQRDVPPGGAGWWDVAAVVLAFPLVAIASSLAVDALFQRLGTDKVRRVRTTWSSEQAAATALVMLLVLGGATALVLLTPMNRFAIFVFVGLSMLFAAVSCTIRPSRPRTTPALSFRSRARSSPSLPRVTAIPTGQTRRILVTARRKLIDFGQTTGSGPHPFTPMGDIVQHATFHS